MANLDELRAVLLKEPPSTMRDCVVTLLDDVAFLHRSRRGFERKIELAADRRTAGGNDAIAAKLRDTARARDEAAELTEHDANPARYWAERELERDQQGFRIPRLADCDWPKHHLRIALDDVERLTSERDKARAENVCWRMSCDQMAADTAETIAAWLEREANAQLDRYSDTAELSAEDARFPWEVMSALAADIRAGRWRP